MERKLATIQRIISIDAIPGADMIEKATILGWEVVIGKKENLKVGDLVVYIEVDSVLPDKPEYEFLRNRKFRIRTIKLKKQVSQGLVLPLSVLTNNKQVQEGDDVTDILEITKYLTPYERSEISNQERLAALEKNRVVKFMMRYSWFRKLRKKKTVASFPYWVSKTDEERIQNLPHILQQFKDATVYVTEKIDYQSVTFTSKLLPQYPGWLGRILPKKQKFIVCSRNLMNEDKNSLYWKIAEKYCIQDILKYNPTITIQGEQGSTSVQGNKYQIEGPELWVFNIIDHATGRYYDHQEMYDFCNNWGLQMVPLLNICLLSELGSTVREIVEYSKGKSVINKNINREGIVVRCIKNGQKITSWKCINPDFLLQYSD